MSGPFGSSQWMYASGGFYGFEITNSLRFNDDDSAFLNRTPSSAGNRRTFTISFWAKKGVGGFETIFRANLTSNNYEAIQFTSDNQLRLFGHPDNSNINCTTTAVLLDPSAWYNFVFEVDTTQATASNRVKIYINGSLQSLSTATYPSQNADLNINNTTVHHWSGEGSFDGYLAEINLIDGTALDPSSFGETKENIWIPKNTSGLTFGTNGFRLQFKNSSVASASSSTVGADTSGNDHHFSSNNIATTDNMTDSPTDNFCTMNPIALRDNGTQSTLSDGNLNIDLGTPTTTVAHTYGTIAIPSSGKYFFEGTFSDVSGGPRIGISVVRTTANQSRYVYISSGQKIVNTTASSYGASFSASDVIGVAVNVDDNEITFFKNGSSQGAFTIDLTLSTGGSSSDYFPFITNGSGTSKSVVDFNFGQLAFTHTPPTGFVPLSTANLPDPAIDPAQGENPTEYFNPVLYTGTGSAVDINTVGFQPDWVWGKKRSSSAQNHWLIDSVRGAGVRLSSDVTDSEGTEPAGSSFDADGFNTNSNSLFTDNSGSYVLWSWKAGGTGVSNTDGSITSTVSASTKAGFSIVSWTGNSSAATSTIGHGLSKALDWLIIKNRDSGTSNWIVWHSGFSNLNRNLYLNGTGAENTNGPFFLGDDSTVTIPTSTVFTVGDNSQVNDTSANIIAYCFHSVDQYSKFDSYEGDHTNGVTVFCNFKPSLVIVKNIDATSDWEMYDATRDSNGSERLEPNTNDPEPGSGGSGAHLRFSSTGFTLPAGTQRTNTNETGNTYIFIAFAAQPFKFANAR
jgi:hypothetical protein